MDMSLEQWEMGTHPVDPRASTQPASQSPHSGPDRCPAHAVMEAHGLYRVQNGREEGSTGWGERAASCSETDGKTNDFRSHVKQWTSHRT